MGQQQLLLLVLAIVIVGIATVAGIQAFGEGKAKADQDAAVSDAMRIVSDLQAWLVKPAAFGGGDGATAAPTFKTLGFPSASLSTDFTRYVTVNGCYQVSGTPTAPVVTIFQEGTTTACTAASQIATVTINDATPTGVTWTYATGGV